MTQTQSGFGERGHGGDTEGTGEPPAGDTGDRATREPPAAGVVVLGGNGGELVPWGL